MAKSHRVRSRIVQKQKCEQLHTKFDIRKQLGASRTFTVKEQPNSPFGVTALLEEISKLKIR